MFSVRLKRHFYQILFRENITQFRSFYAFVNLCYGSCIFKGMEIKQKIQGTLYSATKALETSPCLNIETIHGYLGKSKSVLK